MAKTFTLFFVYCCCCYFCTCEKLEPIHWDSRNDIFRIDNTRHVFTAKIKDTVDILCPLYKDTVTQDETEYSVIYMVSKRGYENCQLDDDAKPVGQCSSPYKESFITISFREFTPNPGGLEFRRGETYYFITTSTGAFEGLHNRANGLCRTKNMRVKFEIVDDPTRQSSYFYHPKDLSTSMTKTTNDDASMDVYLQKLAASTTPNNAKLKNLQTSKWRLLPNEEGRNLLDNTLESYVIESRPQSDEDRILMKSLFLSYVAGADAPVTPKHETTTRLYEIHEIADFDMQSVKSGAAASSLRVGFVNNLLWWSIGITIFVTILLTHR